MLAHYLSLDPSQRADTVLRVTEAAADGSVARLGFAGEIDLSTTDRFAAALTDLIDRGPHARLEVDFRNVGFIDSTGVNVLVRCWQRANERGCALVVINTQAGVHRVLRITGVLDLLTAARSERR